MSARTARRHELCAVEEPAALVLPEARRAERAVASALLAGAPFEGLSTIVGVSDFADLTCAIVFGAVARLNAAGTPADLVTAIAEIERADELGTAGGAAGVAELTGGLPDPVNAAHYATLVRAASVRRQLVMLGQRLVRDAADPTSPADGAIDTATETLGRLAVRLGGGVVVDPDADLPGLDRTALWRATRSAEVALIHVDVPQVRARLAACKAEGARRNGGTR